MSRKIDANDARVEVLLFLGIVFWGWLLLGFFQGKGRFLFQQVVVESPVAIHWDGQALRATQRSDRQGAAGQGANLPPVPAALTPFFFQPIPINSADCELLSTVKGIGPKLAQQIIDTRTANGPFKTASDLLTVPGVGPTRMGQFAPYFSFQTP